jgi:hypothetical protein
MLEASSPLTIRGFDTHRDPCSHELGLSRKLASSRQRRHYAKRARCRGLQPRRGAFTAAGHKRRTQDGRQGSAAKSYSCRR